MNTRTMLVGLGSFAALFSALALAQGKANPRVQVEMVTNQGRIVLELDAINAPVTVDNFLKYVKSKHYDGTVFHRVIEGFMIQGGGLDQGLNERPTLKPIANESANGMKNDRYTIAMARTEDPDSATCQFFINVADNDALNYQASADGHGYTVFGRVVEGQKVVESISKVHTGTHPNPAFPKQILEDVPVKPIVLKQVTVLADQSQ